MFYVVALGEAIKAKVLKMAPLMRAAIYDVPQTLPAIDAAIGAIKLEISELQQVLTSTSAEVVSILKSVAHNGQNYNQQGRSPQKHNNPWSSSVEEDTNIEHWLQQQQHPKPIVFRVFQGVKQ